MYKLPKDFTGSYLIDQTIEVLSFAQYHFDIFFSNSAWMHVESGYSLFSAGEIVEEAEEFPLKATTIIQLLGKRVADVYVEGNTNIGIVFSDRVLLIKGDLEHYEAYRISDGEHEVLV